MFGRKIPTAQRPALPDSVDAGHDGGWVDRSMLWAVGISGGSSAQRSSIVARIFAARSASAKGLEISAIPGSRKPCAEAAFSA